MPTRTDQDDRTWIRPQLNIAGCLRVHRFLDTSTPGNWGVVVGAKPINRHNNGGVLADLMQHADGLQEVAIKIMRGRHLTDREVYRQFTEEAQLLQTRQSRGSAARLLAMGYMQDPNEELHSILPEQVRMCDSTKCFEDLRDQYADQEWRPFLVMDVVPSHHSLYSRLYDLGSSQRSGLNMMSPLAEAIEITIRGLELLDCLHNGNNHDCDLDRLRKDGSHYCYIDHKPEHVIWHQGELTFLDWNGGHWVDDPYEAGEDGNSPAEVDTACFIGYSAFALFTSRTLNGQQITPINRSSRGGSIPKELSDGELLPFFETKEHPLDVELKKILSAPFAPRPRRFSSAGQMANALREYLDSWWLPAFHPLFDEAVSAILSAQEHLDVAQRKMDRLFSRLDHSGSVPPTFLREVQRLQTHLRLFAKQGALPNPKEEMQ